MHPFFSLFSSSEGVTDFDKLFVPLEAAKVALENVWNSVNMLNIGTEIMEKDRYMTLYKRTERAYLTRFSSRPLFNTLIKIKEV